MAASRRQRFNPSLSTPSPATTTTTTTTNTTPSPPPGLTHARPHAHISNTTQQTLIPDPSSAHADAVLVSKTSSLALASTASSVSAGEADDDEAGEETCFICAEPIQFYSVGVCNHRTCHICSIRLRVFYKKTNCTFCKADLPTLLFSRNKEVMFPEEGQGGREEKGKGKEGEEGRLVLKGYPYVDEKLGVIFEDQEMMEATLVLLRFNCPNEDCGFMAASWDGLEKHTFAAHGTVLCHLCRSQLSRFAHEQILYPPHLLSLHDPSRLQRGHRKPIPRGKREEDLVKSWGEAHPMCEFCHEAFFSSDELFKHMRNKHEECFVCKEQGERGLYFQNYPKLEAHFNQAHFPCMEKECLEKKFVVFGSELDWRAHQVAEHKSSMSNKDRNQARHLPIQFLGGLPSDFSFIPAEPAPRRRGGPPGNDREAPPHMQNGAGPSRQPQPEPYNQFSSQHRPKESRTNQGPNVQSQRLKTNLVGGNARRAGGFGGSLTVEESAGTGANGQAQGKGKGTSGTSTPADVDSETASRHADLLGRFSQLVDYSENKLATFRHTIRQYKNNEAGAKDMIDTIYVILERDPDATLRIVREVASLLEGDEEKRRGIVDGINAFRVDRQNEFPTLGGAPTVLGTEYSGIASGRVLSAKKATQASTKIWDRVEQAAVSAPASRPAGASTGPGGRPVPGATSHYPALGSSQPGPSRNATQHTTAWAGKSGGGSYVPPPPAPAPRSVNYGPAPGSQPSRAPKPVSSAAFPSLPMASQAKGMTSAERRTLFAEPSSRTETLRKITGEGAAPPVNGWGNGAEYGESSNGNGGEARQGAKKKPKKELLFTTSTRG